MHQTLRVTWQVAPLRPPLIRRHCSRCAGARPFACSMKFRTNAQKKRIDVWLIYRCSACDEVWNLPIFERVTLAEVAPAAFDAIAHNDTSLALRHAHDRPRLARHGAVEESPEISIHKTRLAESADKAGTIDIALALARPCAMRLDRLLSSGLGVSRGQLDRLHDAGVLSLWPAPRKGLRSAIADGQSIAIGLSALDPALAEALCRRALA